MHVLRQFTDNTQQFEDIKNMPEPQVSMGSSATSKRFSPILIPMMIMALPYVGM